MAWVDEFTRVRDGFGETVDPSTCATHPPFADRPAGIEVRWNSAQPAS